MEKNIFKTREVSIGKVKIGNGNKIAIQSMTDTKTEDIEETTLQIIELADLGCRIVRMTVPGIKEAYAAEVIKNNLIKKGYDTALVADIHFYPKAALIASDFVDKIRINPGNFAEKRATFKKIYFSDKEYLQELIKIEEKLFPLIEKLKKRKIPLRLGVNFGSLSDRIMTKYGNTIEGMIISAFEYTEILKKHDFNDIVFSMKTSDPNLTIKAYRSLADAQIKRGYDYPMHLGVTEAGDEEDGTVKSSIAIGSLLLDGIGDTIRVSLTEDPKKEIKVAKKLAELYSNNFYLKDSKVNKNIVLYSKEDKTFSKNNNFENYPLRNFEKKSDQTIISFSFDIVSKARELNKEKNDKPLILDISDIHNYDYIEAISKVSLIIYDNLIDGIILNNENKKFILDILQGLGKIKYKTEYISCPGCGRTLFDLKTTSKLIKEKTSHLKNLKIAVMGCIVNGPGEMQDSDFGYVGSGNKKIDLYYKNEVVEKNINENEALDKLIFLIKKMDKWVDPSKK